MYCSCRYDWDVSLADLNYQKWRWVELWKEAAVSLYLKVHSIPPPRLPWFFEVNDFRFACNFVKSGLNRLPEMLKRVELCVILSWNSLSHCLHIYLLGIYTCWLCFSLSQENKYKEAVGFYEPIVKKHYDNVSITTKVSFMRNNVEIHLLRLPWKTFC